MNTLTKSLLSEFNYSNFTFDKILDNAWTNNASRGTYPLVNIWSKKDQLTLTAEVPGIKIEDITITLQENKLDLKIEQKKDSRDKDTVYLRNEIKQGEFNREFTLPFHPDSNKTQASLKNGILTLNLYKSDVDKPKTISINVEK